jgi:nucleoside-diphosphate-sugar epimerase
MRIAVTGHHGYLGSVLVPVLVEAGHEVVGIDAFLYRGCDLGPDSVRVPELEVDVRDVEPRRLEGLDALVHLAALSNDPLGALRPELTHEINCAATLRLAAAARDAGVPRFVFASSCSMYGSAGEAAVDEEAPLEPLTAYARSKVEAEAGLVGLASAGFAPMLMRNATAYGTSPRLRLDVVLNNLAAWAFTTGKVKILSDGTPWRPLVHVEDIARATILFLEAPSELVSGQAFNVGADSANYQVRELAELVAAAVPGCEVEYAGAGEPDRRSYRVDFGKLARAFPDFRVEWTPERGVRELLSAFERAKLDLDTFLGDRYTRIKRIERLLDEGRLDSDLRTTPADALL